MVIFFIAIPPFFLFRMACRGYPVIAHRAGGAQGQAHARREPDGSDAEAISVSISGSNRRSIANLSGIIPLTGK
jgi:hypothetical protein